MLSDIIYFFTIILRPFKKYINKFQSWFGRLRRLKYLHSAEEINDLIANFDFKHFEKTHRLDGTILIDRYSDDMHKMTIEDKNGKRVIEIPYMEVINFIKNPDTEIIIECSPEDPLQLNKEFELNHELENATTICEEEIKHENPNVTNDWHPRLASLRQVGPNHYVCVLEKTSYFIQMRTNLSMDRFIEYKRRRTTIRTIELENRQANTSLQSPKCLTSLEDSMLANVIGVSAIWCLGDIADPKFYLMPRNKKVGVYKNQLGMPSGDIECPQNNNFCFRDTSLLDYLKWEIAREFAEETGIADEEKNYELYSIPINKDKIRLRTKLEIIPLAFVRELLRGGKPQMFFLIKTVDIPKKKLKECFKKSLGITEFSNKPLTSSSLSSEVISNYLYAQDYLQKNLNGVINVR